MGAFCRLRSNCTPTVTSRVALGAGQVAVGLGGGQTLLGGGQVGALVERRGIEGDFLQLRPVVGGNDLLGFAVAPIR